MPNPFARRLAVALWLPAAALGAQFAPPGTPAAAAAAPPAAPWSLAPLVEDDAPRPHRRAFLRDGIGQQVDFGASLAGVEARAFFDQGLALLHGLDFHAAERAFRQAAALQPSAAIPWVGAALAAAADPSRAGWFAEEAALRRPAASEREQRLVDAVAAFHEVDLDAARDARERGVDLHDLPRRTYRRATALRSAELRDALAAAAAHDADDAEVAALHAFVVWRDGAIDQLSRAPAAHRDRHVAQARATLLQLAKARPRHPARLHLTALEVFGDRVAALAAVAATTRFAGASVGPWLMAGRLTESLHRHADAVEFYAAALRVAHTTLAREQRMPFELAAHHLATAGLVRTLAAQGRVGAALAELAAFRALPRPPQPGREDGRPTPAPDRRAADLDDPLAQAEVQLAIRHRLAGVPGAAADAERIAAIQHQGSLALVTSNAVSEPTGVLALLDARATHAGSSHHDLAVLAELDAAAPDRFAILARIAARAAELGEDALLRRTMERLRRVGGGADRTTPLGGIVSALAARIDLPADWRLPRDPLLDWPRDLGARPDLPKLGPQRWSPPTARDWTLANPAGAPERLADRRGRPQVVILYLGFGCLHCIEALRAFEPVSARYRAAGIDLVAIGTDTIDNLRASLGQMSLAERLAVPMLSDRKLRVFREWLAFDEFEHMPLHGTFLLDADGRIRWRDVGDVPFERPRWLLDEARRLLQETR